MTNATSFAGLPIKGDISYGERAKDQRSQEEFNEILDRALAVEGIGGFQWHQYTPYFNDGEPCVFSASAYNYDEDDEGDYMEWFSFLEDGTQLDSYEGKDKHGNFPFGKLKVQNGRSDDGTWGEISRTYEGDREADADAIRELSKAIDGGEFNNVLLMLFGDHAEVRLVKNDGIYVEHYDHD